MSFFKEIVSDLRKDLVKDSVKHFAAIIGALVLLRIIKNLKILDGVLNRKNEQSWYYTIMLMILCAGISSFVTYLICNRKFQRLKNDAMHDELTGLYNEKALKEFMDDEVKHAKKEKGVLSVIMYDIDRFKEINDTYGEPAANQVMNQLGYIFSNDKKLSDIVCRQHNKGDEFIVIARGTNEVQARMSAEIKRQLIEKYRFQIKNYKNVAITVSCGIAAFNPLTDDSATLLEKVDKAKQRAKNNGRNCSFTYEE